MLCRFLVPLPLLVALLVPSLGAEDRINHAGRILGDLPVVGSPIPFDSAEADAVLSAMQIFPPDHPWNEDISRLAVLANSDAMISKIRSDLLEDRRTLRAFYEMNWILAPEDQPLVPVDFFAYPQESDPGPYPIPSAMPIEGWPRVIDGLTLEEWQRDVLGAGGDRHAIVVQPSLGLAWEMYRATRVGDSWRASNGALFDLNTNSQRPRLWTSADAAGLCLLAGLVRWDECDRGQIEHALRLVVRRTRRAFVYPATHFASDISSIETITPAMGQRLRLKAGFTIPAGWTRQERAVLVALKTYGALIADNGGFFSLSVAPDPRYPDGAFDHLRQVGVEQFEVVQSTGPDAGPRSPNPPTVNAGSDLVTTSAAALSLSGSAGGGVADLVVHWKAYAGPGPVVFSSPDSLATAARFVTPGSYTLLLSAQDGVHTPAYDAIGVKVVGSILIRARSGGTGIILEWSGGEPPYRVEYRSALEPSTWNLLTVTAQTAVTLSKSSQAAFYRVQSFSAE